MALAVFLHLSTSGLSIGAQEATASVSGEYGIFQLSQDLSLENWFYQGRFSSEGNTITLNSQDVQAISPLFGTRLLGTQALIALRHLDIWFSKIQFEDTSLLLNFPFGRGTLDSTTLLGFGLQVRLGTPEFWALGLTNYWIPDFSLRSLVATVSVQGSYLPLVWTQVRFMDLTLGVGAAATRLPYRGITTDFSEMNLEALGVWSQWGPLTLFGGLLSLQTKGTLNTLYSSLLGYDQWDYNFQFGSGALGFQVDHKFKFFDGEVGVDLLAVFLVPWQWQAHNTTTWTETQWILWPLIGQDTQHSQSQMVQWSWEIPVGGNVDLWIAWPLFEEPNFVIKLGRRIPWFPTWKLNSETQSSPSASLDEALQNIPDSWWWSGTYIQLQWNGL